MSMRPTVEEKAAVSDAVEIRLRLRIADLECALGADQPWPVCDVLNQLADAADILLDRHGYDGDGWELFHMARVTAREHVRVDAAKDALRALGEDV